MPQLCVIPVQEHKFAQRAVQGKQLIINASPLIIARIKCKWERMPLQSLLVKISICDTNGVSFCMHFRLKRTFFKKAISRSAIILMFPFTMTVVLNLLNSKKTSVKMYLYRLPYANILSPHCPNYSSKSLPCGSYLFLYKCSSMLSHLKQRLTMRE